MAEYDDAIRETAERAVAERDKLEQKCSELEDALADARTQIAELERQVSELESRDMTSVFDADEPILAEDPHRREGYAYP